MITAVDLTSHRAYSEVFGELACPKCSDHYGTAAEWRAHLFGGHNLTKDEAHEYRDDRDYPASPPAREPSRWERLASPAVLLAPVLLAMVLLDAFIQRAWVTLLPFWLYALYLAFWYAWHRWGGRG